MGLAIFCENVKGKLRSLYYKRLIAERTGRSAKNVSIGGKVNITNPNVTLGNNVQFRGDCILSGKGPIVIGDNVKINQGTIILASEGGGVYIGKNTAIAAYSYIIDMNHSLALGENFTSQPDTIKKVVIGDNVWIAQNCTILKGSIIGNNAVCAAKTVITGKNIPENAIVAGVPGKVIKYKE